MSGSPEKLLGFVRHAEVIETPSMSWKTNKSASAYEPPRAAASSYLLGLANYGNTWGTDNKQHHT